MTFSVPETAAWQAQRIMKEIGALNEMPMRYRLYDDEPWHSQGFDSFRWTIILCFICLMKPNARSSHRPHHLRRKGYQKSSLKKQ